VAQESLILEQDTRDLKPKYELNDICRANEIKKGARSRTKRISWRCDRTDAQESVAEERVAAWKLVKPWPPLIRAIQRAIVADVLPFFTGHLHGGINHEEAVATLDWDPWSPIMNFPTMRVVLSAFEFPTAARHNMIRVCAASSSIWDDSDRADLLYDGGTFVSLCAWPK
jgi:hypothetical protein